MTMKYDVLQCNVLATLAYYDVFDYPLRVEEIARLLIKFKDFGPEEINLEVIKIACRQLEEQKIISSRNEYYFLFNREFIVPLRIKKEAISLSRWRRIRLVAWLMSYLPFISAVFASGSLAMSNTSETSDLDILIIVRKNKLWTFRLLLLLLLSVLRLRRTRSDHVAPNKICPNHFISHGALTIPFRHLYNAQTYANLVPLLAENKNIVEQFYIENTWIGQYLHRMPKSQSNIIKTKKNITKKLPAYFLELLLISPIGSMLERFAKEYQIKRIVPARGIHISDAMLAFHPESPHEIVYELYLANLCKLGIDS